MSNLFDATPSEQHKHTSTTHTRSTAPASPRTSSLRSGSAFGSVTLPRLNNSTRQKILDSHNVIFVGREEKIVIGAKALVFDIDGTIFENSGDLLHDKPRGAFRRATNSALKAVNHPPVTEQEWAEVHKSAGLDPYSIFRDISLRICQKREDPSLHHDPLTKYVTEHYDRVVKTEGDDLMEPVHLVKHVKTLLGQANDLGLKVLACTSSLENIITMGLKKREVHHYFSGAQFGVRKGIGEGAYCGKGFASVCMTHNIDPADAIAVGDTHNDYGAWGRAGGKIIILRPHQKEGVSREALEHSILDHVGKMRRMNQENELATDPRIIVLHEYDQIKQIVRSGEAEPAYCSEPFLLQ